VIEAEYSVEMAQVNLKRADIQAEAASRNQLNHEALVQNEVAQYQLQAAQTGVQVAETVLEGTKRQVEHWENMRNLPLQFVVQASAAEAGYHQAEAAVLMAKANLAAVEADPAAEDIAVAQAQVGEAEAALSTINVYLDKTTLTAPRDGLITKKLINPGELAAPGSVLLELSDISTVDLIVYIPENRIGNVQIGHPARVFVDAYENEEFEGTVTFIAHQAEFTPRTVQTQEERVNLVFAVKITLDNPDHRLKPGMPADAEILTTNQPVPIKKQSPVTPFIKNTATPLPAKTATPTPTLAKAKAALTRTPTPAPAQMRAEVITWALNVRTGPGVDYPTIATLSQDDIVFVVDTDPKTGWLQVQLENSDQLGWITGSSSYVRIIE
jgi:multidrug resistance efflux pump